MPLFVLMVVVVVVVVEVFTGVFIGRPIAVFANR